MRRKRKEFPTFTVGQRVRYMPGERSLLLESLEAVVVDSNPIDPRFYTPNATQKVPSVAVRWKVNGCVTLCNVDHLEPIKCT